MEGRGIRVEVRNRDAVGTVKKLSAIKMEK